MVIEKVIATKNEIKNSAKVVLYKVKSDEDIYLLHKGIQTLKLSNPDDGYEEVTNQAVILTLINSHNETLSNLILNSNSSKFQELEISDRMINEVVGVWKESYDIHNIF